MKYEIWVEGYAATGSYGEAQKIGEAEADSFDEAVQIIDEEIKHDGRDFGELRHEKTGHWSFWGCRLFDNENDARASFG